MVRLVWVSEVFLNLHLPADLYNLFCKYLSISLITYRQITAL